MTIHAPSYVYNASIYRWVDGDTVDLVVDLGFYAFVRVRCRLDHIDTPERGHPNWARATAYNSGVAPVGSDVVIYSKLPTDKYGRFLVDIYVKGEEPSVNMALVASGLAVLYEGGAK
jgi:micrococcal nuclease